MSLYEVRVFGTYFEQSCVTSFHYLTSSAQVVVSRSFALAAAMGFVGAVQPETGDVYAKWKLGISNQFFFSEIQVSNVYDEVDFYVQPFSTSNTGANAGTPEMPAMAFGLQSSRVRKDIRRGNKRIAGVSQSDSFDGGQLAQATLDLLQDLADDLSAALLYTDEGSPLTFVPVVVSKELYQTPAGNDAYRYYATEIEQEQHVASGVIWTPKLHATTQVSRKRGRGV
jgi:hypothetical protein